MSNITVQNKENWMAIKEQAEAVKAAGLLPANMTAAQATIIILKGQELGIGAMRSLEGLYVVNGKIGMSAALVMGLIRERCPKAEIKVTRKDDNGCVIEATRPGQQTETFSFTQKDAQSAGLIKPNSPWTKYPSSMYWSRCVTNMGRQLFSDILGAPYTSEELGGEEKEVGIEDMQPQQRDSGRIQSNNPSGPHIINVLPEATTGVVGDLQSRIAQAKETKVEEIINESTGEIKPVYPDIGSFEDFDKKLEPVDNSLSLTHWDRIATAGSYEGQSFKDLLQSLGKEKFFALYQASVKSIARMQDEGKTIPQNTQETFKDLEKCCKEIGM